MPSYGPAGIRVHLGTTSLASTTTPRLEARKNEAAKLSEDAEDAVRKSSENYLEETVVGDIEGTERMSVGFLGNAPFLMCMAEEVWVKDDGGGDSAVKKKEGRIVADTAIGKVEDDKGSARTNGEDKSARNLRASRRASARVNPSPEEATEASTRGENARALKMPSRQLRSSRKTPTAFGGEFNTKTAGKPSDTRSQFLSSSALAANSRSHREVPVLHPPSPSPLARIQQSPRSPTAISDALIPKALVLHVLLTDNSFMKSFDDGKPLNLMIDVFFNGTLASSVLMLLRDLKSDRPVKSPHQIFGGTRVDHLVERPWVILPPGQNADGSLRGNKQMRSSEDRWLEVSAALLQHADERGFDKWGERSPSGDYLERLARMEMPEQVEGMQKPGGRSFGVVDVIVTAGRGRKTAAGYLQMPMRLPDSRYKPKHTHDEVEEKNEDDVEMMDAPSSIEELRASGRDAEGETDSEPEQGLRAAPYLPPMPPPMTPLGFFSSQDPMPPPSSIEPPLNYVSLRDICLSSSTGPMAGQSSPMPLLTANSSPSSNAANDPTFMNPLSGSSMPAPSQSRQVSIGDTSITPFNPMAPPNETPVFGTSGREVFTALRSLTYVSPRAKRNRNGRQNSVDFKGGPLVPSLAKFPLIGPVKLNGPPPPVGLFSAPLTSRSSISIDPGMIDPGQPRSSMLIHRLIIYMGGMPIVDHTWPISQRIATHQDNKYPDTSSTKRRLNSLGTAEYGMPSIHRHRSSARMTTPPPTSPAMLGPHGQAFSTHGNPAPASYPDVVRRGRPDASHPRTQKREASPFMYDAPEELLRYRARRRSAQPAPAPPAPALLPAFVATEAPVPTLPLLPAPTNTHMEMHTTPSLDHNDVQFSSSPLSSALSSLASSPERRPIPQRLTPSSQPVDIPSSPRQLSSPPPPLPSRTPVRLLAAPPPNFSLPSPQREQKKEKRKRWGVKAKINKIDTTSNPPLNRDSVICFAESKEDKQGEKPLRQVKCERRGEFTEDMVIVGMRFFVPG